MNTGFKGDDFDGGKLLGFYSGTVVRRDHPEHRAFVKVRIPGLIETESAWARPFGGGAPQWGSNDVPPLGCDVDVVFINGDPDRPKYFPAEHGFVDGKSEAFPEHEDPDVHVFGRGPFRLVIDNRENQKLARFKIVRVVQGEEEDIAWLDFNYEDNSVELYATSALGLHAGAILDIDCEGDIQIKGRKVMPSGKAIN